MSIAEMAPSYLAVAEWEMKVGGGTHANTNGVNGTNGASSGNEGGDRGDLTLAAQYLEKVAQTNAPQRDRAEEALRELRVREARLAAGLQ